MFQEGKNPAQRWAGQAKIRDDTISRRINPPYFWRINLALVAVATLASLVSAERRAVAGLQRVYGTPQLSIFDCQFSIFDRRSAIGNRKSSDDPRFPITDPRSPITQPLRGQLERWRILNSLGQYIDRGRYYCLDQTQYYYLDAGQYNFLAAESYFWRQSCYPFWYDYSFHFWRNLKALAELRRAGVDAEWLDIYEKFAILNELMHFASRVNPFVDTFCPIWTDEAWHRRRSDLHAWPTYSNPGDYIDRCWYYSLDQGQYYYLEEGQYNLLGGISCMLGHPCTPLWYDYHFYWWAAILEEAIDPPEQASPKVVDSDLTVDDSAIPEPSTIVLLGLAALRITSSRNRKSNKQVGFRI